MLSEQFRHNLNNVLHTQSDALLAKQNSIAVSSLKNRSGRLRQSTCDKASITSGGVTVTYPKYIRFLDMKFGRGGRKKKNVPIYNRQVYGYLVGAIRRWLNRAIPELMIREIDGTISGRNK